MDSDFASSFSEIFDVVLLTFIIGVTNLCLGYALAMHLGYGPPGLRATWEAISVRQQRYRLAAATDDESTFDEEDISLEGLQQELATGTLEQMLDDAMDDDLADELQVEAYEDPDAEEIPEQLDPDSPELWDLNEKYVETSILKLNVAMMKSGARATEIDARLRACRGNSELETIRRCADKLKEDCEQYLADQSEIAEKIRDRISEFGELQSLGDDIEMANLEQAAQVETTISNLTHMDLESDLEAANRRLIEEISNLRTARHALRDSQEVAFLAVARYEERLEKVERQLCNDQLTKLRNRIGIEVQLAHWWKQKRHQSRQISAVLFDLDEFGEFNETHGSEMGDRVLKYVAKLFDKFVGPADLVGRYAGQRFLVMMVDVGPRNAVKTAELIRQTIERTTFNVGGEKAQLTTGAGVTEVTPEDTEADVFRRIEEALAAAKKEGPNVCFFHDKREPEIVESPNLGAEYSEATL